MKNRAIVKQVRKPLKMGQFEVYAIIEGEERIINIFSYKPDAEPNDKYWGEDTARVAALDFARRWEETGGEVKEEVIYQTPE
jgi:hypothetical protein